MNNLGCFNLPEQKLFDVKTIIKNVDTSSACTRSRIETIVSALVESLSRSTKKDELGIISLLKTLNLLLQVHVSDEENVNGCNSELAVKTLKISSCFLEKKCKTFDTTSDTLCSITHLSLVLMSLQDLPKNAVELVSKCEESLSIYLTSENQQVDHFHPQIALQLLTIVQSALCRKETFYDAATDDLSDLNDIKISHDLVVQLALCNDDTLRAQVLITLIPEILKQEKQNVILEKLLNLIIKSENEESLSRALAALSALCTYYLPDVDGNLTCCVEGNDGFWLLIQRGLCSDIALTRKHALYLIRRCVRSLSNAEKNVSCDLFFWASNQKQNLLRWWQDICTVLEVLDERAFHLISPVLSTLQKEFSSCVNEDSAPTCFLTWCLTVFRRLLQHSCISVVKWGVDTLIGDVGCKLISSKLARNFYPFFLETLIHNLNSPQIFYEMDDVLENDQEIPEIGNLQKYFESATRSETSQEFFIKLFDVMGTLNWAPISLYIVMKSLSRVPSFKCLNPNDTPMIKRLVAKILASQNVSIRTVSLEYLWSTIINLIDCENLEPKALLNVLTAFYFDKNLIRNTTLWNRTVVWISQTCNEKQVASWMSENVLNTEHSPPIFAQFVILLYNAGLLKSFNSLESLLSLLSDSDTRLYVDQDAQTRCFEFVAHMVRQSLSSEMCKTTFNDKTREAVLCIVKAIVCDLMKLLKMRLFGVENSADYYNVLELLKCFDLLCQDKDVAFIFSKNTSFTGLMTAALDIIENDFEEKRMDYIFAMFIVNVWCKTNKDLSLNCQIEERCVKVVDKILQSNILVQAPLEQISKMHSWVLEIKSIVYSNIHEAQWEFVATNISKSVSENVAVQLVEAVNFGLGTTGRNWLLVLLQVLAQVLPKYSKSNSPAAVLGNCWSHIEAERHKDIFSRALRSFLFTAFQPDVLQNQLGAEFALKFGNRLISSGENASGLADELTFVLQNVVYAKPEVLLLDQIRSLVVSCFVSSYIQRRDQKLMRKITSSITSQGDDLFQYLKDGPFTSARCSAIQIFIFVISGHEKWTLEVADCLMNDLLRQTESDEAKRLRYFANSITHRIQLHVLQGLMLVEPKLDKERKVALGNWLRKRLLTENHQLSVRYLTEWLLVRICCSVDNFHKSLLKLVEAGDIRESALCSVISTLFHFSDTLKSSSPEENEEERRIFLSQFFEALLPLTMSQAYSIRFNAHVALLLVWEIMKNLQLTKGMEQYEMSASAVRKSFFRATNKFQNHRDFYLTEFECVEHYSLETLFYEFPRLTHMSRDEWIKPDLLGKVGIDETSQIPLMSRNRRLEEFSLVVDHQREDNAFGNLPQSSCLQKKMVPSKWLEINQLQLKALPEVLRPWKKGGNCVLPSHGLVVVASLLDKASNLGGLSRTCEIMGASLVLPKMSFALDREFQALSMSSEMWAPLSEVKPHELPKFMIEMKKLGFTLVGAEQTAKSTSLINVQFPENTLLLLGNEREGIPSNLLPLLDVCVEIPQYGLVRSLNVHVAGALFVYEYRRQHPTVNAAASFSFVTC